MSLHAFYGASDAGFHLFDAWSAASDKYKKAETAKLWKSWKPGGPVQVGTLLAMAQEYGFDLAAQYRKEEAAEKLAGGAKAPSTMTEADRQRVEREHAEAAERFRVQLEREQAEAAELACQRWERASSEGRSAYLERKGIQSYVCRFEANGAVLVPMRDVDGVRLGLWPETVAGPIYGLSPDDGWACDRLAPHPWATFETPLRLADPARVAAMPRAFINCAATMARRDAAAAARLRDGDFVREIDAPHDLMLSHPVDVAAMLCEIAGLA